MQQNNRAAHSAITHQKIAAKPNHMHRFIVAASLKKRGQIVQIGGYIGAIGYASGAPTYVFCHRFVEPQGPTQTAKIV
jgi:hypothetical protein